MHNTLSTCNADMVWPENASTTSGLRCITRAEFAEQAVALAAGLSSNFKSSVKKTDGVTKAISNGVVVGKAVVGLEASDR